MAKEMGDGEKGCNSVKIGISKALKGLILLACLL
jgi:hypothetical protein